MVAFFFPGTDQISRYKIWHLQATPLNQPTIKNQNFKIKYYFEIIAMSDFQLGGSVEATM